MKQALYILGQLTDEDVEWLFEVGEKRTFTKDQSVIQRGSQIEAIYIILEGALAVTGDNQNLITSLEVGEIVGEMSFVDARPTSANVTAQQDTITLAIKRDVLIARLEKDPGFASRFYRSLAILLSYRIREIRGNLGDNSDIHGSDEDELEDNVMDTIYMAGQRFQRLSRQVMEES